MENVIKITETITQINAVILFVFSLIKYFKNDYKDAMFYLGMAIALKVFTIY